MKKLIYKIAVIGVIVVSLMLINANYKNGVETCIANGNTRHYCEVELAK